MTRPMPAPSPGSSSPDFPELRVMHVVYSLQPGGMEHGVVKLVNGLSPYGVTSAICSTTPGGALRATIAPDVTVYDLERRRGNDPALVWALYRVFRQWRPHVVHTHAWGTLIEGLAAARLARVPAVVHGEHGTLQVRPYQRMLQRWAWARADRVLSVSSRLAERIEREIGFPAGRITTIRNGVDLARFEGIGGAERMTRGLAPGTMTAVVVGRLVPVKNHRLLLEAIAALRTRGVLVHLLIAGDGPLRGELGGAARTLGVEDAVRFLGHRRDVEEVFAAGDVFVLSSVSEGLSNTILEAMAAGLPVVSTQVGGADEMVVEGETGLLVESQSVDSLASALERLALDPPLRERMGRAGRERAEREFALSRMMSRYADVYREVARRPSVLTRAAGSTRAQVA